MGATQTACEPLRLQVDYGILTLVESLGMSRSERDMRDRLFALRHELSRCLASIEQHLGCPQSRRVFQYLRSLRTTLHQFLDRLPLQGPIDDGLLAQTHVDLQLEPLTCPPPPARNGNRIAGYFHAE